MPAGLPSRAYYQQFVGCVDYLMLDSAAGTSFGGDSVKQRVDLVADRDVHDTLAFCDNDDDSPT